MIPRFLVLDPSTRRRMVLPPPRRDTVPDDRRWRNSRYYVGSALLSRACPGKLCFEVVCFAIDGGHPRAWVASVDNGDCSWRALPRDEEVVVEFDPYWFEGRCVHAGGKIYWHICNSWRLLVLDPATLKFSCLLVPDAMACGSCKYRIGERRMGGFAW
uniref:F-box associated domain-containing protein n=1 Tax=Aegilops tauschii subsp. strangulata TaxID=200361 RepID=A0A453KE92_AEGTS